MLAPRTLAAFVVASISLFPTLSSAAMTEKWHTPNTAKYSVISPLGDIDGDGVFDLITNEVASGGVKIGIRSAATGVIEAQTAAVYQPSKFNYIDLDGDGHIEIVFLDTITGKTTCLDYTTGSTTLAVRWAFTALAGNPSELYFADLDGNGHIYLVFREITTGNHNFEVRNRSGALFGSFNPTGPTVFKDAGFDINDYDNDGRQELLMTYTDSDVFSPTQYYYVYENSAPPVAVTSGDVGVLHSIALGSAFPNPASRESRIDYTLPAAGRASLRLFDAMGREVRTLVDGAVAAGRHEAIWDGRDANGRSMPAGAYFYELTANGESRGKQIVRLH